MITYEKTTKDIAIIEAHEMPNHIHMLMRSLLQNNYDQFYVYHNLRSSVLIQQKLPPLLI
ncbi:transposase [Enterococcus casseliflavus]|uniref:transposase n=1 Tax=Enterococcus casseliflavus TaxID=37734 RepID=UPI0039081FA8